MIIGEGCDAADPHVRGVHERAGRQSCHGQHAREPPDPGEHQRPAGAAVLRLSKGYNVVCIQPLRVKRTTAGRSWRSRSFPTRGRGRAHPGSHHRRVVVHAHARPVMYAGFSLQSYETIFFASRAPSPTPSPDGGGRGPGRGPGRPRRLPAGGPPLAAPALLDSLIMLAYAIRYGGGRGPDRGLQPAAPDPHRHLGDPAGVLFIRHLPYPVRSCTAMLQQIDIRVEEARSSLGVPRSGRSQGDHSSDVPGHHLPARPWAWMTTIASCPPASCCTRGPGPRCRSPSSPKSSATTSGRVALASILILAAFLPLFLTYRVLGERSALGV